MDRHNGRSYPWAAKSLIAHDSRKEARSSGSLESLSCHAWQDASVKDGPAGRWAKMRTFFSRYLNLSIKAAGTGPRHKP